MSAEPIRPSSIPYPNVWLTFEAPDENGKLVKYRIEDLPAQRFKCAVKLLRSNFLSEETLCRARNVTNHKSSVNEFHFDWKETMRTDRLTLVCFKENSNEIVAVDVLCGERKNDVINWFDYCSKHVKDMDLVTFYIKNQFNLFENYQVDRFLSSRGMSVLPKYRGRGIAMKLLEARKLLGNACGLSLIAELCPSSESQKFAEKAGYEKKYEITFEELAKKDPRYVFDVSEGSTFAMYTMTL